MRRSELLQQIRQKQSFLCVGLDTELEKIPAHLRKTEDPLFAFNKEIIDHTAEYSVAYKINTAFYENLGSSGWQSLARTLKYIPEGIFTIADAKRGDIGNTARMYAEAFFENLGFDAVTLSPYMGKDSIDPFLKYEDKWVILLGLTSNEGANDFQMLKVEKGGEYLYEYVIKTAAKWSDEDHMMFVAGANRPGQVSGIRKIIPHHFLLVPGVGAQGASLDEVSRAGLTNSGGLLVNSSRAIIYAGDGPDFGEKSRAMAQNLQAEMRRLLL